MAVYTYPAAFLEEADGGYSVIFQDSLGGCTCGDNIDEAMEMAMECLALVIDDYISEGRDLPKPEKMDVQEVLKGLDLEDEGLGGFINYVGVEYESYSKEHFEKAAKKTLTIPKILDLKAKRYGINCSQTLQEALSVKIKEKEKEEKKLQKKFEKAKRRTKRKLSE